jgi:anti-sigma-K factor RskA
MKLGWAFGAMLYEINALPFTFTGSTNTRNDAQAAASDSSSLWRNLFIVAAVAAAAALVGLAVVVTNNRRNRQQYAQLGLELGNTGGAAASAKV